MRELTQPAWMYVKAALFVAGGLLAGALLLVEQPKLKVLFLLVVAVWCFCRAYYFAFYVVEQYADRGYRFTGLLSFAGYLLRGRRGAKPPSPGSH